MSQKLAAERLGRAQSHISNLERGPGAKDRRNIPALAEVEALLDYYLRVLALTPEQSTDLIRNRRKDLP